MSQDRMLDETELRDVRMALTQYATTLDQTVDAEANAEPAAARDPATVAALVERLRALDEPLESVGWAVVCPADFSADERDVIRAALELRKQTTAQIQADNFPDDRLPIAMAVVDGYEQLIARFGPQDAS